jgi:hypothetical protein
MHEILENLEEYFLELRARIDEGDEKALEELKSMKKYLSEINAVLELIDDDETIESMEEKMKLLEKRFDMLMMELSKVVG